MGLLKFEFFRGVLLKLKNNGKLVEKQDKIVALAFFGTVGGRSFYAYRYW